MGYTLNDILNADFDEVGGEIKAKFRKVIMIKDYQPEEIEIEARLSVEHLDGSERVLITAILAAQLEISAYVQFMMKRMVTKEEYNERVTSLCNSIDALASKYQNLTGKDPSKYLKTCGGVQVKE